MGTLTQIVDTKESGRNLVTSGGLWNFDIDKYNYRYPDNTTRNCYHSLDDFVYLPAGHDSTLFRGDHEFHIVLSGRMFSQQFFFGVNVSTQVYYLNVETSGKIRFTCRFGGANTVIESDAAVLYGTGAQLRRAFAKTYIRIQINFTNDTFKLFVNGGLVPTSVISGNAISTWQSNYYTGTNAFAVGHYNNNNSLTVGLATYFRDVFYSGVSDILTESQAIKVSKYLLR